MPWNVTKYFGQNIGSELGKTTNPSNWYSLTKALATEERTFETRRGLLRAYARAESSILGEVNGMFIIQSSSNGTVRVTNLH